MADLAYADLIAAYPEFTTTDAAELSRIATAIDLAEARVATGVLKTTAKTTLARLALAAHYTRLLSRSCEHTDNGAGPVLSRTHGDRSITYGAPAVSLADSDLASTPYGVLFRRLMQGGQHRRPLVAT